MGLIIDRKIWELVEKLYITCYQTSGFIELLKSNEINLPSDFYNNFEIYSYMSTEQSDFGHFMQLVPSYRYLRLIGHVVFDEAVIKTQHDNWNFYGTYIKNWYPKLIGLLKEIDGLEIRQSEKKIIYQQDELDQTRDNPDFLTCNFQDYFLEHIKKEINECYANGHYLAVMVLTRKLMECLVLRIFELVFRNRDENGVYNKNNHLLWFDVGGKNRTHDFEILISNLKSNSAHFHDYKDIVEEVCVPMKALKDEINKIVHRDYKNPDGAEVDQWNIPRTVSMLCKIYRNYCNP